MRLQEGWERCVRGITNEKTVMSTQFGGDGDDSVVAVIHVGSKVVALIESTSTSLLGISKPAGYDSAAFIAVFDYKSLSFVSGAWLAPALPSGYYGRTIASNGLCGCLASDGTSAYTVFASYINDEIPPVGNYTHRYYGAAYNIATGVLTVTAFPEATTSEASIKQEQIQLAYYNSKLIVAWGYFDSSGTPWRSTELDFTPHASFNWSSVWNYYGFEKTTSYINMHGAYSASDKAPSWSRCDLNYANPANVKSSVEFSAVSLHGFTDESDSNIHHFIGYADNGREIWCMSFNKNTPSTPIRQVKLLDSSGANWSNYAIRSSRLSGGKFILVGKTDIAPTGTMDGFVALCSYSTTVAPYYSIDKIIKIGVASASTMLTLESHADGFVSKSDADLNTSEVLVAGKTTGSLYATISGTSDCIIAKIDLT